MTNDSKDEREFLRKERMEMMVDDLWGVDREGNKVVEIQGDDKMSWLSKKLRKSQLWWRKFWRKKGRARVKAMRLKLQEEFEVLDDILSGLAEDAGDIALDLATAMAEEAIQRVKDEVYSTIDDLADRG